MGWKYSLWSNINGLPIPVASISCLLIIWTHAVNVNDALCRLRTLPISMDSFKWVTPVPCGRSWHTFMPLVEHYRQCVNGPATHARLTAFSFNYGRPIWIQCPCNYDTRMWISTVSAALRLPISKICRASFNQKALFTDDKQIIVLDQCDWNKINLHEESTISVFAFFK